MFAAGILGGNPDMDPNHLPEHGDADLEPDGVSACLADGQSGASTVDGHTTNGSEVDGSGEPGEADEVLDDVEVRSVAELAKKYGFTAPDEWVGPESSRAVLDYGRAPVVLADSSRKPNTKHRDKVWDSLLSRYG